MSEIAPEELIARLRLIRTRHVGPITYHELLDTYGSAFQAIDTLPDLARRGGSRTALTLHSKTQAEDEIADLKRLGGSLLCHDQGAYPALLKAIDPPPPLLFARGRVSLLREPMLAMVGARNASTNGRRFASRLAAGLGEAGFVIASGLARGIDAAAHRGALPTGTVAVLGGGLDQIYPPENTDLYGEIAATGVVLSERPLGHVGRAQDFPRRNRIISGMALGTLVVEAALRSGSLITARFAGEQGREVFAVPGSPLDERCRGTNRLIRDGAHLVEDIEDVLAVLGALPAHNGAGLANPNATPVLEAPSPRPSVTGSLDLGEPPDTARARLLTLLGPSPTQVDTLLRESGLEPGAFRTLLLELELAGRIERQPGNKVARLG